MVRQQSGNSGSRRRMEQCVSGRVRVGEFELDLNSGELCTLGTVNGDGRVLLREQTIPGSENAD